MSKGAEGDLLEAIKESLKKDGTLGRFKGEIRAAVINVLNRNTETGEGGGSDGEAPKIPDETKLINELIREYLNWNGYIYTEQVLTEESGQNSERTSRDVLTTKLGVIDDAKSAKIPLLYYIVSSFQNVDNN